MHVHTTSSAFVILTKTGVILSSISTHCIMGHAGSRRTARAVTHTICARVRELQRIQTARANLVPVEGVDKEVLQPEHGKARGCQPSTTT